MTAPAASGRHLSKFKKRPKISHPTAYGQILVTWRFAWPNQLVGFLFMRYLGGVWTLDDNFKWEILPPYWHSSVTLNSSSNLISNLACAETSLLDDSNNGKSDSFSAAHSLLPVIIVIDCLRAFSYSSLNEQHTSFFFAWNACLICGGLVVLI